MKGILHELNDLKLRSRVIQVMIRVIQVMIRVMRVIGVMGTIRVSR